MSSFRLPGKANLFSLPSYRKMEQRNPNLLRHKFQMMLHQELQERFSNKEFSQIENRIHCILTNALFGVVQMWIARGKRKPCNK